MKKIIRLTESDLMRIVKKVIKEQTLNQSNGAQYCLFVKEWQDIDDDVKYNGTWRISNTGNEIEITRNKGSFVGFKFGGDKESLKKPKDFDVKMKNKKSGTFEKSKYKDYEICFR